MSYVITNLDMIDDHIKSLNADDYLPKWLSKVLKKEVAICRKWLTSSSIKTSDDEHVQRAIEKNEEVFDIVFSDDMRNEIQHVVDWLAELGQRDPRLFSKLDRITWKQAVEHSARWHEQLVRRVEKMANGIIPFDDDCPVMFTHDDGMKWVWLKTDKARDDEGRVMGHCVGSGGYDRLDCNSGVFSLRDIDGRPHVTVQLMSDRIIQAKMKGNADVSEKYSKYVDELYRFMKSLLMLEPKKEGVDHLVWWNGDEEWYLNGRRHREDGPAIIKASGGLEWYLNGCLHRVDGPAVIKSNRDQEWWVCGRHHRVDGPAVIKSNGDQVWWVKGERHREDGPAVVYADGGCEWWRHGEIHRDGGPAQERVNGAKCWYKNGELHREDGPAIIWADGSEFWYRNGERHRDDGPAVELWNGSREWYKNGVRHREDGPAIILADGSLEWWIDGERHREGGPAIEWVNGDKEWFSK